jgi:chromosome segregation ATPase
MPPAGGPETSALAQAIDSLREQLGIANGRADRAERRAENAEQRIDEERSRVDRAERLLEEARTQIADAVGAERIAAGEAAALRAELDRRRGWRLLRRLRWALRGDRRAL